MNGADVNPRDPSQQDDPFSVPPQAPGNQDFSQYADPLPDIGDSDDATMRKIRRRTTPVGKVMTLVLVLGAGALGYWAWDQSAGYDTRMDELRAAGQLEGDAMLAALRTAYGNAKHEDVRERILLNLGAFKDEQSIPLMIDGLSTGGIVRRSAARALAHVGSPAADVAKPKLLEVLPETDARDRPQVVWALAVLGEEQAVPAILEEFAAGHLQNLESLDRNPAFDPKVITEVVGVNRLTSDELVKHEKTAVRALVAKALSESPQPQVVPALIKMLEDEEEEVVKQAAAGLGRSGDDRAGQPLFDLLTRRPNMRHAVMGAIEQSTSAPGIAKLVAAASSTDLKRSLASALADTHDPRAADPLAALLTSTDEDIKQTAALGLAELGDPRAIPVLLEQASVENRDVALDAVDALAALERPEVGEGLLPLLNNDDFRGRRAGLMKAIGKSGYQPAGKAIAKFLGGDDVEAASFALGDLDYAPAYKGFLKQLKRPKDVDFGRPSIPTEEIVRNREIAIRTLGRYGRLDAVPGLMTIIEDELDSAKLRLIAGTVLGQIADAEVVSAIVAKAKDSALPEDVRKVYVRGLWAADVSGNTGALMDLLQPSVPPEIRRSAALAVGYAADPANDSVLSGMLDNADLRRDAAFAIVLGGDVASAEKLYAALNQDRELREVLQEALMADDIDWFNRVTKSHFESGEVYRRLRVAEVLRDGQGDITFTYPWTQITRRLGLGWGGAGGLSAREIRARLYQGLRGDDAEVRRLAAEALDAMNERGLLLASRDEPGPGQEEARMLILRASQVPGS